ncbi:TetR/AcrR family transcriptional regulator [Nocardia tengchongensis]|uniref:TetR/AcrR family transcriptional regulator n=1 Tax=Nocardia tengchongensis TaxID=2055889 RepID=A0ABX8CPY4_9NOCA|nr:TetR/AcrR family transcriptional regulator [Nocardia tengchongensis]QVI21406.1 TetR/AcrR family transcriptional regulator [Nocardia tengchongensis]
MRTDAAQVLDSAIPVLAKDRGASMQVIATRAGISRATLTRMFPTRQLLVQAMAAKILDDCDRALTRAETVTGFTDQILAGLVAEYRPFAQLWNLVYVETDVLGAPEATERAEDIFARTVALLAAGQHAGVLRTDMPPTWLASTFCGLAETAWELTLEGHMGTRQAPDFITTVLLHGLGTPAAVAPGAR